MLAQRDSSFGGKGPFWPSGRAARGTQRGTAWRFELAQPPAQPLMDTPRNVHSSGQTLRENAHRLSTGTCSDVVADAFHGDHGTGNSFSV